MKKIRQVLAVFVGHVDHGKSSLLDAIRGTSVVEREAGKITQAIGASIVPIETIKRVAGPLLEKTKLKLTIPGLLFIDTPGHAAFSSLRKRGGSLADIAVLVVDINEGFKPQTIESVELLKASKTPFIVAANKIDLLPGWQQKEGTLLQMIQNQPPQVVTKLEENTYELVGRLNNFGIKADRFDRVQDYSKQVAIVPTSATNGIGIPELLMVLTGLAQKFLEESLEIDISGPARGSILEVKEETGLGTTLDVIIADGTLKVNDTIVIGHIDEPIVTKVKCLFEPAPLAEMRDKKAKFKSVKMVRAAVGVKISAQGIKDAVAGMPIRSCEEKDVDKVKKQIMEDVASVVMEKDHEGVVIKADNLGSLEALEVLLREKKIPIKKAAIGNISKKDISAAEANLEKDPLLAVVIGFNVTSSVSAPDNVKVFTSDVIYTVIEDLEKWQKSQTKKVESEELGKVVKPCKFEIMRGYIFRQNNPAIVGVSIEAGTLHTGAPIMNKTGKEISRVKSIQMEQEKVEKAEEGKQAAVSLDKVTVGRQINEGDTLYTAVPEADFRKMKELKEHLKPAEKEVLKEIAKIKRQQNLLWGV